MSSLEGLNIKNNCSEEDNNAFDFQGRTALHIAVKNSLEEEVQLLLEKGTDIESKDLKGNTALCYAIFSKNQNIFKILLQKGADLTSKNYLYKTPLHHAVIEHFESAVEMLLKEGADMNAKDIKGYTPLHHAIYCKHESIVGMLLHAGAELESQDEAGQTPLHVAVAESFVFGIHALIGREVNVNVTDSQLRTPLHVAVLSSDIIIETLLQNGAWVEAKDENGETALHLAARKNFKTKINVLLANGANINVENVVKSTPLDLSICKSSKLVDILLNHGADVHHRDAFGSTALHHAVSLGQNISVELLLQRNADINAIGYFGNTPLLIAVKNGNRKIVKQLLANEAAVRFKDISGCTALHYTVNFYSMSSIIGLLLKLDFDDIINTQDTKGQTALHVAVENVTYCVNKLLTWGASVDITDNYGRTPLQLALDKYLPTVINPEQIFCASFTDSPIRELVDHILKLKLANINVFPKYKLDNTKDEELWKCYKAELNRMKGRTFGIYSLYDALVNTSNIHVLFNENLEDFINSSSFKKEFPKYGCFLKTKFLNAKKKKILFEEAQNSLLQFVPVVIPPEVVAIIFSLLKSDDLVNIIKANHKS